VGNVKTIYEVGNWGQPTRYHRGASQNQDANNPITIPAKGFLKGNAYFRYIPQAIDAKAKVPSMPIITESNSISYNYESNYWDKGRVQVETPNQKQQRIPYLLRWGGKLFQTSQINNMSSFDSGNYKVLSAKFGAVTAMRERGYTLKIIQESNISSAFIGRREIQNADGSTQLVVTDSLIGTVNPSEYGYGTKYPGSVVLYNNKIYFVDTIKGVVIRDAENTPFPISDYGMSKYWRAECDLIESASAVIVAGFNKQENSLYITWFNGGKTISFYEPERQNEEAGWVANHNFAKAGSSVEMMAWIGKTFTTFIGGELYEHNVGTNYLQMFGEQKTLSVTSVFNPEPNKVKVFLAHSIHANIYALKTILTCPVTEMFPVGMRTILVNNNYKLKEGVYYAALKKDGYTKGPYSDTDANFRKMLISGREMRGHVIFAEITYADSKLFVLFTNEMEFINSEES